MVLGISAFFVLNIVLPVLKVKADSKQVELLISFRNKVGEHEYDSNHGYVQYSTDGDNWINVNTIVSGYPNENNVGIGFSGNVNIEAGKSLKIRVVHSSGYTTDWMGTTYKESVGSNESSYALNAGEGDAVYIRESLSSSVGYTVPSDVTRVELYHVEFNPETNQQQGNQGGQGEQCNGPDMNIDFGGSVDFLWKCNNKICKSTINVPNTRSFEFDNGEFVQDVYKVNYIPTTDVVAEDGTHLNIKNVLADEGTYFFTWVSEGENSEFERRIKLPIELEHVEEYETRYKDNFDLLPVEEGCNRRYIKLKDSVANKLVSDWASVYNNGNGLWTDLKEFINDLENIHGDIKRRFAIDPTGGINGENSISTNGDRNFRATIYDPAKYKSLVFDVNPEHYTYYLGEWDPVFKSPELDISDTTIDNPAWYDTYILEKNLKFKLSETSNDTIVNVEPINVDNKKAVKIENNNGEFTINFESNYYDSVVFEIKTSSGGTYYVEAHRKTVDTYTRFVDDKLMAVVKLMFPYSEELSTKYTDYEVIANVVRKDGTFEAKSCSNIALPQDLNHEGDQNSPVVNEWQDGKNIKAATYGFEITDDIASLSFNVIHKGALDSKKFGGVFAGSGKGFEFEELGRALDELAKHSGKGQD